MSSKLKFDKDAFTQVVKECSSLKDLCRYYERPLSGYYTKLFQTWIEKFQCDTSHFYGKKDTVECAECGKRFEVNHAEAGQRKFCSLRCANQIVRGNALSKPDDELVWSRKHRIICFRYHPKKCVVCPEAFAVTVHHYNGNHNDDTPSNLVPICANHHIYLHSKEGNALVQPIVDRYVENFKRGAGVIG